MSTDLTTEIRQPLLNVGGLAKNQYATDDSLKDIKSGSFTPYMKLYGNNSNEVKERKIAAGHYGMVDNKDLIDLGEVVNAIPIAWRWKAVRIIGDQFETYYNPTSEDYKQIKDSAKEKVQGNMEGPEVLLWLSDQKRFATWHMSNESAKKESGCLTSSLGSPVTLKWRLASSKKFKWEAPVIMASSTPPDNLPDSAELAHISESFANPRETANKSVDASAEQNVSTDRR